MSDYVYRLMMDQQGDLAAQLMKFLLLILSFVYRGLIGMRNFLYQRGILPVKAVGKPVISVGNITWGGVGKTPFVIFLLKYLRARDFKPAVLTRGYMKKNLGQLAESDEVAMMRQMVPDLVIGVGADRWQISQKILAARTVDAFILDDGFQHRRVQRQLDIVLIDSTNPFGNGQLIPRGILREPLSALKRAQIIVLTKSNENPSVSQELEERLRRINESCVIAWAAHVPQELVEINVVGPVTCDVLRDQRVISFCSIGDPKSFSVSLSDLGVEVKKDFVFIDHYSYTEKDIQMLIAQAQSLGIEDFVTTAKDAVKLEQFKELFGERRCWILKIEIELKKGKEEVFERIDHLLGC
jgi:tetraacyldisaccharide 4'-kinase